MNRGASESSPTALVSLGQSSSWRLPLRILWASMRARLASRRMVSCSRGISRLKTATGSLRWRQTCSAMFRTKEVFPMLGRPAMMIRSEACSPEVRSSRSSKPVARPVMGSSRWNSSSSRSRPSRMSSRRGAKPPRRWLEPSAIRKMRCSA